VSVSIGPWAEPAVRTGALIGYARVSASGQLLDRQQHVTQHRDMIYAES